MSRALPIEFTMSYRISFSCAVRGHHIYKALWTPTKDEKLYCRKDERMEAEAYDSHAIGVYKTDGVLVGHIPIEISSVVDYFLRDSPENRLDAIVIGKRKREVGLVIPAKYIAITKDLRAANILKKMLEKRKTTYSHFDMEFDINQHVRKMPIFNS